MVECLKSLQKTNPTLLLTAKQLRSTVRDTTYIPSAAGAITSVVCKSRNLDVQKSILKSVGSWNRESSVLNSESELDSPIDEMLDPEILCKSFEDRLRLACSIHEKPKKEKVKTKPREKKKQKQKPKQSFGSITESYCVSPNRRIKAIVPPPKLRSQESYASWGGSISTNPRPTPVKESRGKKELIVKGGTVNDDDDFDDEWW